MAKKKVQRKHSNPKIQKQLERKRELVRQIRAVMKKTELISKHRGTSAARHAGKKVRLSAHRKKQANRKKK